MTYTLSELKSFLDTLGLPVFYKKAIFRSKKAKRYIVYHEISSTNVQEADDATVWKSITYQVNLVTEKKDEVLEQSMRDLLTSNHIIFTEPSEDYNEEERLQTRVYEFELDRF